MPLAACDVCTALIGETEKRARYDALGAEDDGGDESDGVVCHRPIHASSLSRAGKMALPCREAARERAPRLAGR